ncbi:sensor histidine kinase [Altererythrobacter endophyticus]|uniref:histidine kinase n=2 Tax=Altericroceibacterium endophyticum TaxID=1808508 RepID=A0A6I4T852_9SPHN|nr:HAMP domain-containing sensor histidine kinase [Altericroceibacterium endophyticum]MXO65985.1 sensor histidine kinase [Altericroceibacterium endophyticum]
MPRLTTAECDGDDRLVAAEEPLARLQRECGGDVPGVLAIPALLQLVRKSRHFGLKLAQPLTIRTSAEYASCWAEIRPQEDKSCQITLSNWRMRSAQGQINDADVPSSEMSSRSQVETAATGHIGLTARLDPQQRILAVESFEPDLSSFTCEMETAIGQSWTGLLARDAFSGDDLPDWRKLDGRMLTIPGSERNWTVRMVPLGQAEPGAKGFELSLFTEDEYRETSASTEVKSGTGAFDGAIRKEIVPVLKQPISRIIANAETIRAQLAGPLSDEYSNYAADIASAGEHLLALISDLADLEVVEADNFTTAPDHIDLLDVARRATGILGVRARERGIGFVLPPDDVEIPAVAEFRRVLQILLNLLGNAVRYSPSHSVVTVDAGCNGANVWMTIRDEGKGIAPEQRDKMFAKFERLGRSGDGGTGLGLYISRRLARQMGGDLVLQDIAGKGASFLLTLPARQGAKQEKSRRSPKTPTAL